MRSLLAFSALIDALNEKIGSVCNWLVLLACVVSAGNAMVRYAYDTSSNAWLEIQWYMFAVIVMFGASYTMKRNEHVRVDLFYMTLEPPRAALGRHPGHAGLPPADLHDPGLAELAVLHAVVQRQRAFLERRRPAALADQAGAPRGLRPGGAAGLSELIKRVAFLNGHAVDSLEAHYERPTQ